MNKVLTLALMAAMASGTAFAAGGGQRSEMMGDQYRSQQQQGMADQWQRPGMQQQSMNVAPNQALDESMVREIQQQLQSQGYNVQTDGIFGPNTQQALRQFQNQQGIQGTGQVNLQTLSALGVMDGSQAPQQAEMPQEQSQQQQEMQRQQEMQTQQGGQGGMTR